MSELIDIRSGSRQLRRRFLTSVSLLALMGMVSGADTARADDDVPTLWIELGGQLEQLNDAEEHFAPAFVLATPRPSAETISPLSLEHPPRFSYGGEGKISFEPENSEWVLSASVLYGRSNGNKHFHQQANNKPFVTYLSSNRYAKYGNGAQFMDTVADSRESHAIVDFQAGRDVGMGMFGGKGLSVFSLGVRIAQFSSSSHIVLKSDPDFHFHYVTIGNRHIPLGSSYHSNTATLDASRSFRGIGPSLSWNASAPFAGNSQKGEISFDWGLNAAVLFGRQRAKIHHQTTGRYHGSKYGSYSFRKTVYSTGTNRMRARMIVVPNVGATAALSFHYADAKVTLGYSADMFFGAMDGGIDAHKNENRSFYGPFVTVAVGLGAS
ncbi:MAG TPA: hypothetical protein VIJ62_06880 [Rhizomicrobium sp.]